jgi:tripartite-type tricarboxylate transporter receptor subunit TctC
MATQGKCPSPASLIAAACLFAVPATAAAQSDYPNRPIKIIAPVAPGTVADAIPRIIAEKLSERWRQPVVVENRPGGANNIGTEAAARADSDGYTLLAAPPTALVINQHLYPKLAFDPAAFVPVTVLADQPNVLAVHPKVPAANLGDLVAYAKANPGKLTYGSSGIGTVPHLSAELFNMEAGTRMVHVPYRGLAPALTDLVAGHIDIMFDNIGTSAPLISAGSLKGLGFGGEKRSRKLPDMPAIAEVYPGFASVTWFAIVAPPKTPAGIANQLSLAVNEALRLPDVTKKFDELHATPVGGSPADTAAFMKRETERWRKVIESAGIKAE